VTYIVNSTRVLTFENGACILKQCLPVYLCAGYLSICVLVCLFVLQVERVLVYLFIYVFICSSIYQSVCLLACYASGEGTDPENCGRLLIRYEDDDEEEFSLRQIAKLSSLPASLSLSLPLSLSIQP